MSKFSLQPYKLLIKHNFAHFQTVRTRKGQMSSLEYLCYQMQIINMILENQQKTRRAYASQIVERQILAVLLRHKYNHKNKSSEEIHSYNTRYGANQNFFKPSVRTNYGVSTFQFSTIRIWESVPPELKRFPYMLFKKRYKRFLLTAQN